MTTEDNQDPVYEMLWDCRHCGTTKLLGLTHRYCPMCGAPQDAAHRYFPAEEDKVAVQDHVYAGRDVVCRYCGTYNGKRAKHCKDCGGPLEEGSEAATRQDQLHAIGQYTGETVQDAKQERTGAAPGSPVKKPRSPWPLIIGALIVVLVGIGATALFWKREAHIVVASHTWQREIDVERFGPVDDSAWCDELPRGAKHVTRRMEVRSHRQVPDGEDCKTRKIDQGDGTFKEKRECTPRYKKEPVKDERCHFTIDRWSTARTLKAQGAAIEPAPHWPPLELTKAGCSSLGCEREGARRQTYTVHFRNSESGDDSECEFEEAKWRHFSVGQSFTAKVGVLGSWLDCSSL